MGTLISWVKADPSLFAAHKPLEALKSSQGAEPFNFAPGSATSVGVFVAGAGGDLLGGVLVDVLEAAGGSVGCSCVGATSCVSVATSTGVSVTSGGTVTVGGSLVGVDLGFKPEVKTQLTMKIIRIDNDMLPQRWLK
jgi:hypothetical protein